MKIAVLSAFLLSNLFMLSVFRTITAPQGSTLSGSLRTAKTTSVQRMARVVLQIAVSMQALNLLKLFVDGMVH